MALFESDEHRRFAAMELARQTYAEDERVATEELIERARAIEAFWRGTATIENFPTRGIA